MAKNIAIFAASAIGLMVASGSALAQQSAEIVVVAPHFAQREVGRTSSGIPIEEVSLSNAVAYNDLDLRNPYDVDTLRDRVEYVAMQSCRELGEAYPLDLETSNAECARSAIREAMPQVDEAVAVANGYGYGYGYRYGYR